MVLDSASHNHGTKPGCDTKMTLPRVFIIESLELEDEDADRFEGGHLSKMLALSGVGTKYMYLRTERELEEAIDRFEDSEFRYLHFSCHGNKSGIATTFDSLTFEDLGERLRPVLARKRVFFSSCSVMNDRCATALLKRSGCYSVVGPSRSIGFDRSAAFWCALYHLLLRDEATKIKHGDLQRTVGQLRTLFGVQMRYYHSSRSNAKGFVNVNLDL